MSKEQKNYLNKIKKEKLFTVCTEWGGAMSPGDKAGVHYDYMDYNANPTNYFIKLA